MITVDFNVELFFYFKKQNKTKQKNNPYLATRGQDSPVLKNFFLSDEIHIFGN